MKKVFEDCDKIIVISKKLFCRKFSHYVNHAIPCTKGCRASCEFYEKNKLGGK